jgi:hypothetical protein
MHKKRIFFIFMLFFSLFLDFLEKYFKNKVKKLGYDNEEKIYGHSVGSFRLSGEERWGHLWW